MRKLKLQFSKKNAIFGAFALGVFALLAIFSGGLFGLAAVSGVAMIAVAPIALTDKEQAFADMLKADLQAQAEKLGKGYITAEAFTEKFNASFIKAMTEFNFDASKVKQVTDAVEAKLKEFDLSANSSFQEIQQKMEILEQKKPNATAPKTLVEALTEIKGDIKQLTQGIKGEVNLEINAADTLRSSVADNDYSQILPEIGQLAVRKLPMKQLCRPRPMTGKDNNGTIRYTDWDADTIARAAAMVAEGDAFPESTAKFAQYTATLKKIGDTLPVSEEMLEDMESLANELEMFLETNIQIKEDEQLLRGSGTGENMTGLLTSAIEFPYADYADSVSDASIYDLLVKILEDITTTGGNKYLPNFVLMPSALITKMMLKKDGNNNYVLPPFMVKGANNQMVVANLTVIEENGFTDSNQLAVGDSRYMELYFKAGLTLTRGTVNAQFSEDMITLKARMRELLLIRNANKGGFRKVSNVSTALTELEAVQN